MTEIQYCEACCRLLSGNASVRRDGNDNYSIYFDHHLEFESFKNAMRLPCGICTLAWSDWDSSPYESSWDKIEGRYATNEHCDIHVLEFFTDESDIFRTRSRELFFDYLPVGHRFRYNLSPNTGSNDAMDFLLEEYRNCLASHTCCNALEPPEPRQYPLRLLDVGDEGAPIILRNTRPFHNQDYICLSHCWGNSKPYILNSKTKGELELGIDASLLPQTFQDAIYVTRYLQFRFLWIDSLCIIQDSGSDWAFESGRMDQIYAGAACTIAATASNSSNGGLFFPRHSTSLLPFFLDTRFFYNLAQSMGKFDDHRLSGPYVCDVLSMATHYIERAPLNLRAWVSQERQLSRRTLHFSRRQLFWECHTKWSCETYPDGLPYNSRPIWSDHPTMLKECINESKQRADISSYDNATSLRRSSAICNEMYWAWCSFRVRYSAAALSKQSDKLVALRGIAQQVSQITGDTLVAGLWQSRMIEELCWFKTLFPMEKMCNEPTEWRAPTWSWASSNAKIWPSTLTKLHQNHKGLNFDLELTDIDFKTKPSGELEQATLRIKCRPMRAMIKPDPALQPLLPYNPYELKGSIELIDNGMNSPEKVLNEQKVALSSDLHMDYPNAYQPQQVYLIVVQTCLHANCTELSQGKNTDMMEGLILRPTNEDATIFSRIGQFHRSSPKAVWPIIEAHQSADEKIITLV